MSRIKEAGEAVLYPMHIEGILVGDNSEETANINEDYDSFFISPAGNQLVPDVFNSNIGEYDPGIYLHFILPEEWTHGVQSEDGSIIYPILPDRWLITRYAVLERPGQPMKLFKKDWILESSAWFLTADDDSLYTEIYNPDPECHSRLLGRLREYDGRITGEDPHLESLTAVMKGIGYFAGYYPECKSVLGFHDSLEDLETLERLGDGLWRLTYAASGWVEDTVNRIEPMNLCHGLITELKWYGSDYEYDSGVPKKMDMPRAAVGNTAQEALAALLQFHGGEPMEEELFKHLFYNTLMNWGELDGAADGARKIHQEQFFSESSPEKLILDGKEIRYTAEKGALLNEIYCIREEKQALNEEIQALYQEIYLFWTKTVMDEGEAAEAENRIKNLTEELDEGDSDPDAEEKRQEIRRLTERLLQIPGEIKAMRERMAILRDQARRKRHQLEAHGFDVREADLRGQMERLAGLQDEKTAETAGNRYWLPKDFTIMLEGAAQSNLYKRLDRMKEDGAIYTRTASEILTKLEFKAEFEGKSYSFVIEPEAIRRTCSGPRPEYELPPILDQLAKEGLLIARSCIYYYTESLLAQIKIKKDAITMSHLIQAWEDALTAPVNEGGRPPSPAAVYQWKPSWNPLILEWMLRYYPDPKTREGRCDLSDWDLEGSDYVYREKELQGDFFDVITGRSVLTFSGVDYLTDLFHAYAKDPAFAPQVQKVKSLRILSQKMQGMTDALLGRDQSLLIEPDPSDETASEAFYGLEQGYMDRNQKIDPPKAPLTDFYAIRAGRIELSNLRVIDTFGRVLVYPVSSLIISNELGNETVSRDFWAKPRILAPARLSAIWNYIPVAEQGEEVSCIYGWLWPNLVDACLHVYQTDGTMLGSIQARRSLSSGKEEAKILLRNPPGEAKKEAELLAQANEKLASFLQAFLSACKKEPQTLQNMISLLDESLWDTRPDGKSHSDVNAWLGRPVAIVGVKTRLELKRAAPCPMEYQAKKSYQSDLQSMKIPMRIGEAAEQKDGAIGVFFHGDGPGYETLFPCRKQAGQTDYYGENTSFTISINRENEFTVLCSPYARITMTTGLLPAKELKLNDRMVERALDRIYMTLYCAPILTEEDALRLLLPAALEKEWKFLDLGPLGEKQVTDRLRPPWTDGDHKAAQAHIREGWLTLCAGKEKEKDE